MQAQSRLRGNPLRCEYGIGDFYRAFEVGEDVDAEQISAELQDGVLELRMPTPPQARPLRIPLHGRAKEGGRGAGGQAAG